MMLLLPPSVYGVTELAWRVLVSAYEGDSSESRPVNMKHVGFKETKGGDERVE